MKKTIVTLALAVAFSFGQTTLAISVPAVGFNGFSAATNNVDSTAGWLFTANDSIVVTDLGVFDAGSNGLAAGHDVGLWTSGGVLLASATVPAGLAAPIEDGFRYASITPVNLLAGMQYIVAANNPSPGDIQVGSVQNFVEHPSVDHVIGKFSFGPGLLFPTLNEGSSPSIFGANFKFTTVPEPATASLALLGLGGLMLRRRRMA